VLIFKKIKRVNVQVVDSTGSSSSDKIDIGFRFVDPSGKDVETLDPSNGGSYTGEASLAGDFSICLVHIFKSISEFKFNSFLINGIRLAKYARLRLGEAILGYVKILSAWPG
jgi:hypothetical protein